MAAVHRRLVHFQSLERTFTSRQWGVSTDIPLTGDYDADGKADVAVYRPSTGVWWVFFSSTQTHAPLQWGIDTDIPVPADYTGDGRTNLAVYRPSNGHWFVFDLATGTYARISGASHRHPGAQGLQRRRADRPGDLAAVNGHVVHLLPRHEHLQVDRARARVVHGRSSR